MLPLSNTLGNVVDGFTASGSKGYPPHFQNPLVILLGVIVRDQALESNPEKSNFVTTRLGFKHQSNLFSRDGTRSHPVVDTLELCVVANKIRYFLSLHTR